MSAVGQTKTLLYEGLTQAERNKVASLLRELRAIPLGALTKREKSVAIKGNAQHYQATLRSVRAWCGRFPLEDLKT